MNRRSNARSAVSPTCSTATTQAINRLVLTAAQRHGRGARVMARGDQNNPMEKIARLKAEVDRLRDDLADARRERDALANELKHARRMGEITAGRIDAINDFIDPATGMAAGVLGGERVFVESDLRAALSAGGAAARHAKETTVSDWWVVNGEALLALLRRAHDGEDPDLLYAEHYTNSDHEVSDG